MMFGLLNIHKPIGMTSRDVVNRVAEVVRPAKAGHAGTLDPLASGVLGVCVGPATRLIEYVQRLPKSYTAAFTLGRESPTGDLEGPITTHDDARQPTHAEIVAAAARLAGEIDQVPPAFSAVKVGGRRSYRMARKGTLVALAPRKVIVHRLEIVRYAYPDVELSIECGSGTYVRALGRDLAKALGTVAVMSALVRTAIGHFTLDDALSLDALDSKSVNQYLAPATSAVASLQQIALDENELRDVLAGKQIRRSIAAANAEIAAVDATGQLRAILRQKTDDQLQPEICFPTI
jgi:tRNA pseudouridine55 synthase